MRDPILNKTLEQFSGDKITLRPSSIDGFSGCSRQWALVFLGGMKSIPSGRAAIGTAIHAAVEQGWKESIAYKRKAFEATESLKSLAADNLVEQDLTDDIRWDNGEDLETGIREAQAGVETFISDIVPFVDIPEAVEERFTIKFEDHPIVDGLSGTVDYRSADTIADVKTSKRKPVPQSYETQQSLYKL